MILLAYIMSDANPHISHFALSFLRSATLSDFQYMLAYKVHFPNFSCRLTIEKKKKNNGTLAHIYIKNQELFYINVQILSR